VILMCTEHFRMIRYRICHTLNTNTFIFNYYTYYIYYTNYVHYLFNMRKIDNMKVICHAIVVFCIVFLA
jgi:hypothetical protein